MSDEEWQAPEEEQPPEHLQKKWEKEDFDEQFSGKKFLACSHCGKMIDHKSFSCIYCGETVFKGSDFLGRLSYWLIRQGNAVWVVALIVIGFFLWMVL